MEILVLNGFEIQDSVEEGEKIILQLLRANYSGAC